MLHGKSTEAYSELSREQMTAEYCSQDQKWESARFLLKVSEQLSLTHSGVDTFCEYAQSFVDGVCSEISHKIRKQLPQELWTEVRDNILASCKVSKSRYRRERYYQSNFNYVVGEACKIYT